MLQITFGAVWHWIWLLLCRFIGLAENGPRGRMNKYVFILFRSNRDEDGFESGTYYGSHPNLENLLFQRIMKCFVRFCWSLSSNFGHVFVKIWILALKENITAKFHLVKLAWKKKRRRVHLHKHEHDNKMSCNYRMTQLYFG